MSATCAACSNCRHWLSSISAAGIGTCIAAPPCVVIVDGQPVSRWPETMYAHLCGTWSPRVPPPDPAPHEAAD